MSSDHFHAHPSQSFVVWGIAIGSLILAACYSGQPTPLHWRTATPRPIVSVTALANSIASVDPIVPAAIMSSPTTEPPTATSDPFANYPRYTLTGVIYDAGRGITTTLTGASVEWHFGVSRLQRFDGNVDASHVGRYQLPIRMLTSDEIAITARAPGYIASTIRLHGSEIGQYGPRLDFGLFKANQALPTMPGDLGVVELRGIVYNAARGVRAPIGAARVRIVDDSVVRPDSKIDVTTTVSGTFNLALQLHTTDRLELTIQADGFISTTLTRRAKDLINQPPLLIALKPISP